MTRAACALALAFLVALAGTAAPPAPGYAAKVTVGGPTRLDWTFVLHKQSIADPPAKLTGDGYDSAKQTYDEILKKKNDAETVVGVETNAQGETIRVQDPANVPQSPVAPKRGLLTLLGSAIGLLFGLIFAALYEVPRMIRIQTPDDAKHYTRLPVLASVPPLLSATERSSIRRAGWMKLAAGAAAAVGIIPLIVLILQATRVFDRMVS